MDVGQVCTSSDTV